jgi:hypothetical protein
MTNKLGVVKTFSRMNWKNPTSPHRMIAQSIWCDTCQKDIETGLELPESLKDVPDGFIIYVDDKGQLQAMEEDPHDYR